MVGPGRWAWRCPTSLTLGSGGDRDLGDGDDVANPITGASDDTAV